jgi:RNA polymerase sigma factor (sigma-70 family)
MNLGKRKETQQWFEALVKRHREVILSVCIAFYPYDEYHCHAVQQQVLFRLWKNTAKLQALHNEPEVAAWIFTVARNEARRYWKKQHHTISFCRPPLESDKTTADDEETSSMIQELYELLDSLPEDDRKLLLLYIEKKTLSEIAEALHLECTTVGMRIHRLKNKLKLLHQEHERE